MSIHISPSAVQRICAARIVLAAAFAALLTLYSLLISPVYANDGIFSPAPSAAKAISFDGRGFLINGQRTFITSGSLHYARVPRALWRDRLLRMKAAGFNTVQTYVFWNFHEPKENEWDFSGDKDLDAFLKLVRDLGMYCTVRVGPYACAEWDSGGYPVWLRFKPGVLARQDNPQFLAEVDKWYDKVLPIVVANQINRGGSVIFVQLENEYGDGWGTDDHNSYLRHLRAKALSLGVEVPYFFSGLHHGSDPAGDHSWDSTGRSNPWYTTEFWPGWYNDYGPLSPNDLRRFDRGTWKIIAYGGNGYNYYMLHGGTNFASWNNNEDASSYDYSGAIGQAGDLRPVYYRFKKAAWFARSFPSVLENSHDSTSDFASSSTNSTIKITARTSPTGTIVFYDNPDNTDRSVAIKPGVTINLAAGEIAPVVENYALAPGVRLGMAAHVLRSYTDGTTTTLVVYGDRGPTGVVDLSADGAGFREHYGSGWIINGESAKLTHVFGDSSPEVESISCGSSTIRIVEVAGKASDFTWYPTVNGQTYLVVGPEYVRGAQLVGDKLVVYAEKSKMAVADSWVLTPTGDTPKLLKEKEEISAETIPAVPTLANWNFAQASGSSIALDDSHWMRSTDPQPMGADGDYGAYAWYRTTLNVAQDGDYKISFQAARDQLQAFVDGNPMAESSTSNNGFAAHLIAGNHSIAVFASSYGRDKLFGYTGSLAKIDSKGLSGSATIEDASSTSETISAWKAISLPQDGLSGDDPPAPDNPHWQDTKVGADYFNNQKGDAWFSTTLPDSNGTGHRVAHFESVDDNGVVFLNGKKLMRHEGWSDPFDVDLDSAWNPGGPNILDVLVENTDGAGGIMKPVSFACHVNETSVAGWKMKGGIEEPAAIANWAKNAPNSVGLPTFYRTTFTMPAANTSRYIPVLRVVPTGLHGGFIWVNGHNLGRYPEKLHVDGLYVPPCWLKSGLNDLVIFDEYCNSPDSVHLTFEAAAGRTALTLSE